VHRSNSRLGEDLALVVKHQPERVIASVGTAAPIIAAVHAFGGLVFADARALYAAAALGCDFAYMGTRFIASEESLAGPMVAFVFLSQALARCPRRLYSLR
jgi:nitronate monooxygenase